MSGTRTEDLRQRFTNRELVAVSSNLKTRYLIDVATYLTEVVHITTNWMAFPIQNPMGEPSRHIQRGKAEGLVIHLRCQVGHSIA